MKIFKVFWSFIKCSQGAQRNEESTNASKITHILDNMSMCQEILRDR